MNWRGSREADARLSAREAVKVRAALAESISSQTLYEAYLATSPNSSGNIAQDRARARAWAIINVRVNMEALKLVLIRIWTTGYLLGELSADELLGQARRAQKSAMITKKETDAPQPQRAITMDIDWDSWTPGDQLTAAMLKPPKGLRRLLDASGVSIKGINNTTLNDIGNALGEAVALGLAPKQAAKLIRQSVGSPARALSISITEMNRAVSAATIDRYRDFGLTQMRWVTFDPCDKCAMNDQEVANIGAPFPSGDTQTPAHPNCRCRLAPVIPGSEGSSTTVGDQTVLLPSQDAVINAGPTSIAGESQARSAIGRKIDISQFLTRERTNESDIQEMGRIIYDQGWNKAPLVATPDDYEKLKASQEFIEVFRGGPKGMRDGFLSGKPWVGDGNAGPGTYVTTDRARAEAFAELSKMKTGESEVISALLPAEMLTNAPDIETSPVHPLPSKWNGKRRADYVVNAANGVGAYEPSHESSAKGDYVIYNTSAMILKG